LPPLEAQGTLSPAQRAGFLPSDDRADAHDEDDHATTDTIYGESSDGRKWIKETHGGVTYVRPR
jgi:hypothetical protein